jgi:hypothetical protein
MVLQLPSSSPTRHALRGPPVSGREGNQLILLVTININYSCDNPTALDSHGLSKTRESDHGRADAHRWRLCEMGVSPQRMGSPIFAELASRYRDPPAPGGGKSADLKTTGPLRLNDC